MYLGTTDWTTQENVQFVPNFESFCEKKHFKNQTMIHRSTDEDAQ